MAGGLGALLLSRRDRGATTSATTLALKPPRKEPRPLAAALPLPLQTGDQLVLMPAQFAQAYSVLDFEAEDGSEFELEYAQRYFGTGRKPADPTAASTATSPAPAARAT